LQFSEEKLIPDLKTSQVSKTCEVYFSFFILIIAVIEKYDPKKLKIPTTFF